MIRIALAAAAAAAALSGCAVSRDGPVPTDPDGDALLSDLLAGKTQREPVSCVRQQDVRNIRSAGNNRIVYDGPGGTTYVNHATGSCPLIQPWHAIRHRSISTNICSGELIRVFDPQTGIEFGGCTLGEFVPWRRPR